MEYIKIIAAPRSAPTADMKRTPNKKRALDRLANARFGCFHLPGLRGASYLSSAPGV